MHGSQPPPYNANYPAGCRMSTDPVRHPTRPGIRPGTPGDPRLESSDRGLCYAAFVYINTAGGINWHLFYRCAGALRRPAALPPELPPPRRTAQDRHRPLLHPAPHTSTP
ncbi:hypothetical protein PCASD_02763 [Puccinia coronata f. sp. avenae]|uniref:Uncharacterized protein n=1 Tax=Puccinia coronata f. sp. avenae TaxID=200324 RepID=A0A2N5VFY3_9BASI|nr:hypothetical protein PCASD_02763 [Puccinia coronata f. sp. avenae]